MIWTHDLQNYKIFVNKGGYVSWFCDLIPNGLIPLVNMPKRIETLDISVNGLVIEGISLLRGVWSQGLKRFVDAFPKPV